MNTIKPFTMSLHQATNVLGAFQRMVGAVMPARLSFIVARNIAALAGTPEIVAAEQTRSKLIRDKHGKASADGQSFSVQPENMAAFQADFAPVGAELVEVRLQVFPADAPEYFPPISPADVLALEQFIEGDPKAEEKPPKKKRR